MFYVLKLTNENSVIEVYFLVGDVRGQHVGEVRA
jgi:hypothetical protein